MHEYIVQTKGRRPAACQVLGLGILATTLLTHASSKNGPAIGDKPPLLEATTLLQAPPGATLDAASLRGKVVVLEFWATWCGPCVAAIPHLNQLADHFAGQPVQFIAITAEEESKIKPFLAKRPIHAWVALDTNNAMNKAYGIIGIPHTVILGRDGRIAAITHPRALTQQHLKDVLADRKISLLPTESGITAGKDPEEKSTVQPLFQVLVRPSSHTNNTAAGGAGRFTARGYTVRDVLPRAFDQRGESRARMLVDTPLPEGRYDFIVTQTTGPAGDVPAIEENVGPLLQLCLRSAFGLVGGKETRDLEVMILRVKRPIASGLVVSPTPGAAITLGPGIVEGTDLAMSTLVAGLERGLNKPVYDETGLTNHYDISLKWDQKSPDQPNPDGLKRALETQLGLELIPGRRPVAVTVIEKVKNNATVSKR